MSTSRLILRFLLVTACAVAAFGADAPATKKEPKAAGTPQPTLSPRFKQVRDKIMTLFEHRSEPPPPAESRSNPFRPPGAPVATAPILAANPDGPLPAFTEPEPPSTDLTKLQESVATLKFGGTLERGDSLYLMINRKPYKDNEVVQAQVQGEIVYLRVKQISRHGVTVVLNDAEMTLKF